jgi:Zn-dependent metalloprotease
VLWHEYGHAIQSDQVPGWGYEGQTGAIGEGFGDYMAVAMSQAASPSTRRTPHACVMDWDATSYTSRTPHCLRRTDSNKTFPDDLTGEVHADGEIWSRALWDINRKLGRNRATRVIVEAQFWMNPRSGMPGAARQTVKAAQGLYDAEVAAKVRHQFVDRGILPPLDASADK